MLMCVLQSPRDTGAPPANVGLTQPTALANLYAPAEYVFSH